MPGNFVNMNKISEQCNILMKYRILQAASEQSVVTRQRNGYEHDENIKQWNLSFKCRKKEQE